MAALSELTHEAGAVVIADEVLTGMGRCGAFLASSAVGLSADILCLGKALGGGLPLSACVGRAEVMAAWPASDGEAIHTSTFLGHPLACAAGIAVLETTRRESVVDRVGDLGTRLLSELRDGLAGTTGVGEVRGLGLLGGVELLTRDGAPAQGRAAVVAESALSEGVLVLPAGEHGHVVELTPPASLTDAQKDAAVGVLARAVRKAVR
jgi:4-aminobutyrate aminotransferase/(S)-3-amino-2-methylpropionate transaminase